MLTEEQAEISSEALLLPERERLSRCIVHRAEGKTRSAARQRSRRMGALAGGVVGCGLYFGVERSLFIVLASALAGSAIFDLAAQLFHWRTAGSSR